MFVTATLHLEEVEEEGGKGCVFARCTNIAEEFTGIAKGVGPRLRECCRVGPAEVVSKGRKPGAHIANSFPLQKSCPLPFLFRSFDLNEKFRHAEERTPHLYPILRLPIRELQLSHLCKIRLSADIEHPGICALHSIPYLYIQ